MHVDIVPSTMQSSTERKYLVLDLNKIRNGERRYVNELKLPPQKKKYNKAEQKEQQLESKTKIQFFENYFQIYPDQLPCLSRLCCVKYYTTV